jgi:Amino acid permease
VFYWISIGSILLVLSLSANTAFADFPRLARAIAQNGFLPHSLTLRGRRLVFSQGVYALAILAGVLLTIFGGVTDRLIPLYAFGAFLAFTLSQAGMVIHWRKAGGPGARRNMFINGLGAVATAITVSVVLIAKFTEGAWIVVVLIPAMILTMHAVRHHYDWVARETATSGPINTANLTEPIVVIPVEHWSVVSERALRFAWRFSHDIRIVHVECGADTDKICREYSELVEIPAKAAGLPMPELVVLPSPYRFIVRPILDYALGLERDNPDKTIAVLIPELVESRWYYYLLHNNRSQVLKALLLFGGNRRTTVINIPWYLKD